MEHEHSHLPVAACTIIARNYLAQASVLIDSYLTYAPDAHFYLFIVDGAPPGLELQPSVCVLGPDDVRIAGFREMSFKYEITELCTAVKPSLLRFILSHHQEESVVYFDPDILVFREMGEVWDCLAASNIVLIPHLLDPIPLDGLLPDEKGILAAGTYNLGFIALKASLETERLLQWWQERLQNDCRVDLANGLFVDQKWMDLVPNLFAGTTILRDDTYDVAYWNLHSRCVERREDQVLANGRPLAFFHFSGYHPAYPRTLSRHQNRLNVAEGSGLAYLLDTYAALLYQRDFRGAQQWQYGYGCFGNGVAISTLQRQLYLGLDAAQRARFGDPFRVDGRASFFSWSVTPSPDFGEISPFLDSLLAVRPDVRDAIPEPRGRNREQYVRWAMTDGATQMGFDPLLADVGFWSKADRMTSSLVGPAAPERQPVAGVNVCGYLRNETGLGAVTRGFIHALRDSGVPTGLRDLQELSPNRSEDPTLDGIDGQVPHDINIVCVNADQHFVVKSHLGEDFFSDRYNIGVWFWELPSFPREWWDRFDEYDEIWATSSFIANTLAPISPIPIVRIPPVLASSVAASRESGRERLGVEADEFVYLFTFDFASYFERKNPLAIVEAFRQSYRPGDRARLVVKCVNQHLDQPAFERLVHYAADLPVSIHSGYWAAGEMRDLTAACDAYVSLHRSEGLGLTIADAMALGKPAIATGWSGNADFMTPANSFPVGYELIQLERDFGPYRAGSLWAEPSIPEASHFMRLVYEDRGLARDRGAAGRRDIERDYSVERVGERVRERLAVISARKRKRESVVHTVAVNGNNHSEELVRSDESHPRPAPFIPSMQLGKSSHGPLGVLAKRGMDFILRYHTHYQSEVNVAFSRFMAELDARQIERDRDIQELFRRSDLTDPDNVGRLNARVEHLSTEARLLPGISRRIEDLSNRVELLDTHTNLVAGLNGLAARTEELHLRLDRADKARALEDDVAAIRGRFEELGELVQSLDAAARAVRAWQVNVEAHLGALSTGLAAREDATATLSKAVDDLSHAVKCIEGAFAARPYMAADTFGGQANLDRPMGFGLDAGDPASVAGSPPEFEDLFRGSPAFIAERQRIYLPFFEGLQRVIELGSGRGEFLDLLHERGIEAVGVELNEALAARSRARGRRIELADALAYLEQQADESIDAIFSAQLIEHLESARLGDLLRVAYEKLRPKGLLIAETVNPESHTALKTFYVDLTHHRPIYPQVLLHLCQRAGFASGRIFYPLDGGFTQAAYARAGEYALIAIR